ncbi:MAG: NAD-dependent succinate-semialdehyde dehydrogenase [Gammaproteobacteria bacterium]|nr:MAG: NAD-dependent succinate-semialdehyde dehydrogenase [Gammaproteobacteria bacterium]
MAMQSINPATGEEVKSFDAWDENRIHSTLQAVADATPGWQQTSYAERARYLRAAATVLRDHIDHYSGIITLEMGKPITEARTEIEKCASVCDYYADHGEDFLKDEPLASDAGKSYVAHLPLGTVLAVMPWNFPFWQVFRFAAPGLMAGNTGVLKHASNVPQCALAIEEVFNKAGFPDNVFRTLMISAAQTRAVIEDARVHAVTLTGSEPAGRQVAATAGANLKKTVLELGGSDAFVVLKDADLELAATAGVQSRFLNAGQSCIAAKRFILAPEIADDFLALFKAKVIALKRGDPTDEATRIGPMARADLRDELHEQVTDTIAQGAVAALGCEIPEGPGSYYAPSILDQVQPGMLAYEQELFGPVAIVIRARDEADALRIANDNRYGLGGSVWTEDSARGEAFARQVQSGATFVNGMVKSDPRLPFGGIKASGYGRELAAHGIKEFTNTKTLWIR